MVRLQAPPADTAFAGLAVLTVYVFHALFGALRTESGLAMTLVWSLLVAVALSSDWGRRSIGRTSGLVAPGVLFGLVLVVALWSLTPWTPGGPHPAWSYVGRTGAASVDPSNTVVEIAKLTGLACAFVCGVALGGSDRRAQATLSMAIWGGAVFFALTLAGFLTGWAPSTQPGRFDAQLLSPNTAATLLGMLLLLAASALGRALRSAPMAGADRYHRLSRAAPQAAALLLFLVCLLLTASRTAIAATAVAMLFQQGWDAASYKTRLRWVFGGAALLVLCLMLLVVIRGELLLGRLPALGEDFDTRASILALSWKAFVASPLNGYGLGSFDAIHRAMLNQTSFPTLWSVRAAHNVYLQWLVEAGVLGAAPMFLCIASLLAAVILGTLRRSHMKGWLHALIAGDLVILLHGLTDFALQTPSVAAFWALTLGLQLSLSRRRADR